MIDLKPLRRYAPALVRITLSLVFLWFSFSQFKAPAEWTGFLPSWTASLPLSATHFIYLNAGFELLFGVCMLIGILVRTSSLLLGLHLIGIAFSLGYGALAVRDFGLAFATLSIFLNGADVLCLSWKDEIEV